MADSSDWVSIHGKILVVDDDFIVREMARAALEKVGCTVYDCVDGETALAEFIQQKPDIVLLDVLLPGKSGFEVCSEIRALPGGSDVPIVIMTGLDDNESILTAYRLGASDFITKPINWEALPYRMRYIFRSGRAFRELRNSEKKLTHAQLQANMGSWEWDPKEDKLTLSPTCGEIIGVEDVGRVSTIDSFAELIQEEDRVSFQESMARLGEEGQQLSMDCRVAAGEGEHRYVHLGAENNRDHSGEVVSIAGTIQDITERKRAEEKIRYLAYYDNLTGLPNRTLFKEHLKRALAAAEKLGEIVAILFIDLDRFKTVNDSFGHDAGDRLLKDVAERIQRYVRKYDTISRCYTELDTPVVSRLGGDEFTILLEAIHNPEIAATVARRVIDILEPPFIIDGQEVCISASIGISIYPDDGADADSLVKCADIAMYSAKDRCQGSYQYYRREMNEASMRRIRVEKRLRRALEDRELTIVYQPQVDCESQRIIGLEALIRWEDSELGIVPCEEFIAVAEESGLIVSIDRWMFHSVIQQLTEWQKEGICPDHVSVNISPKHFHKKHLHGSMAIILNLPDDMRRRVGIEITERCLLENMLEVTAALVKFSGNGIRITLDDFGTGYSSLDHLTRIPCHTLKIDKSVVARLSSDKSGMTVVTAIIALAKSLQIKVIAEGVETLEQLEYLKSHGCTVVQGYLFHRPLPAEALHDLLSIHRRESSDSNISHLQRLQYINPVEGDL